MNQFCKYFILITLLFLGSYFSISFAQAPDTAWTKTYGGVYNDEGVSVQETIDGGFIITGATCSFGGTELAPNVWLIKTDASGDTAWTKIFGRTNYFERGCCVEQTADSGYIIMGINEVVQGTLKAWLIKTNSSGESIWNNIYGWYTIDICCANSGRQTSDAGYIFTGCSGGIWLVKTNSLGDTVWTKTFSGWRGNCVRQTSDGGYIVTGIDLATDVVLIKTDSLGDTLWTKSYGGGTGYSVQLTGDGGYIIAGEKHDNNDLDVYLVKADENGDTLWTKTYGGDSLDVGYSTWETTDNGYIIAGYTYSFGAGSYDLWVLKTDALGDTLWTKLLGGSGVEIGYSIQQCSDNGYIVTGFTSSYGSGSYDLWLVKIKSDVGMIESTKHAYKYGFTVSPNPFSKLTNISFEKAYGARDIELKIYDVAGKLVSEFSHLASQQINHVTWNGTDNTGNKVSAGIYFVQLEIDKENLIEKVLLLK